MRYKKKERLLVAVFLSITFIPILEGTVSNVIEGNNAFGVNFYHALNENAANSNKNIIFSPLSIQSAGGLLYSGTKGQTADEILKGFSLPGSDKSTVNYAFEKYLHNNINNESSAPSKLNMVNKVYLMKGYTLKPSFSQIASSVYDSSIDSVDFSEASRTANTINEWVENNTNGKIKDLVSAESFDGMTRMYLVNAITFKCEWENKFSPENTREKDFYTTPDTKIAVQMMSRTGSIEMKNYFDINAIGINLKFKDSDLSLFVLMPQYKDDDLSHLEGKLSGLNLPEMFGEVEETVAALSMPKFKIEMTIDLKEALLAMNVKTMFDYSRADFSDLLDSDEPLYVSDAIHKAFIEINEDGGEASAASGVGISSRMGPMLLSVNRSFIYFIKSSDGEIYFMGRFTGQQ